MTFKNLYFGLLGLLIGLLASVYCSSEKLDRESFGSPSFDRQVVISNPSGDLNKVGYRFRYSPSIQRHLTLPKLLSVVVGIAVVLGLAAHRKQSKKEPNKALEPTRTSVTPPAGAGVAPAVRVGHL
jgi:hypothetical protein